MDNFNNLIDIIRGSLPIIQPGISALVGSFVTSMFLRGNTRRAEFEKIKVGKVGEAIDDLRNRGELTLTELVKCKNLIEIAKLADVEYSKYKNVQENECHTKEFCFDWFVRFFEAAGNVNDDDMQQLWAKVLAGEFDSPGSFTLRTIDVLYNLTRNEAKLFEQIAPFVVTTLGGRPFITDMLNDFALPALRKFGFDTREILLLQDSNLLTESRYHEYLKEDERELPLTIENGEYQICMEAKRIDKSLTIIMGRCELTNAGQQIMRIMRVKPNNDYLFMLAKNIKEKFSSDYYVSVFKAEDDGNDDVSYNENEDMLSIQNH